jgi:ATP-dependent DNA ligase
MLKVKHVRTADCVVAGFRWYKDMSDAIGSLLLGLYDDEGVLHHVGVTSAFTMATRKALAESWRRSARTRSASSVAELGGGES